MDWNSIAANWDSHFWSIHEEWPQFTEEEIRAVNGNREGLIALVRTRYHLPKREAERQVFEYEVFYADPMETWELI